MTTIKICGIKHISHALVAAKAGADYIGLVFAPSRRTISCEDATKLVDDLRQDEAGKHVKVVGVFVNETPTRMNDIAAYCGLDYVQLSGDETPEAMNGIQFPVIKSLRMTYTAAETEWLNMSKALVSDATLANKPEIEYTHQHDSFVPFAPCPFIVDAHVAGSYGGAGVVADWEKATTLAKTHQFLLAGGLNPENVVSAITQVAPWGVDVSSGVETNGVKDTTRIEAFIRIVRSLDMTG